MIRTLTVEGYKSIRSLRGLRLRPLNVLIGANGSGKSNFVSLFRLLRELTNQRLQMATRVEGGADACLHLGPKVTQRIEVSLSFDRNSYEFALVPTVDNRLIFEKEVTGYTTDVGGAFTTALGSGHAESRLREYKSFPGRTGGPSVEHYVFEEISKWVVYHFHDTSATAGVRRQRPLNVNEFLQHDGENLAAFLYRIREDHARTYEQIRNVVRLAAPFFDDFKLRPVPDKPDLIQLEWSQAGSDYPFLPSQLSDGTLRFICLATALLQPWRLAPSVVLFDEPELGLHPYALTLLAGLLRQTSRQTHSQVIVCTQSALLLSEFEPEDVIVVERRNGESVFQRLDSSQLSEWLKEYSLGELWLKNVFGGRPHREDAPQPVANSQRD